MRYVELFAGVGGFRVGLGESFDCVFSNEFDKYARSVYRYHFGECDGRDIRDVPIGDIPDADLWVGGPPCQDFSVAGRRAGMEGDRGNLFLYTLDLVEAKRPKYFLFENVGGLLSIDNGRAFANIVGQIAEMGYCCQWICLNSKHFGVPQNRERLFIVGSLGGEPRPEIFSFGGNHRTDDEGSVFRPLQAGTHGAIGATAGQPENIVKVQSGIRRLTPLETERLQAFPDSWTARGIDDTGREVEISDTQRYKMMGNAVTTSVIAHFARAFARLEE